MKKQTLNTLLSATFLAGFAFFPQVGKAETVEGKIKKIEQELSLLKREKEVEQEKKMQMPENLPMLNWAKRGLKFYLKIKSMSFH